MANMSYCRFENTYADLIDCAEEMDSRNSFSELSTIEKKFRNKLVALCKEIANDFDEEEIETIEED